MLEEDDRCLHVALPIAAFLEMLAGRVVSRSNSATRLGVETAEPSEIAIDRGIFRVSVGMLTQ